MFSKKTKWFFPPFLTINLGLLCFITILSIDGHFKSSGMFAGEFGSIWALTVIFSYMLGGIQIIITSIIFGLLGRNYARKINYVQNDIKANDVLDIGLD